MKTTEELISCLKDLYHAEVKYSVELAAKGSMYDKWKSRVEQCSDFYESLEEKEQKLVDNEFRTWYDDLSNKEIDQLQVDDFQSDWL